MRMNREVARQEGGLLLGSATVRMPHICCRSSIVLHVICPCEVNSNPFYGIQAVDLPSLFL